VIGFHFKIREKESVKLEKKNLTGGCGTARIFADFGRKSAEFAENENLVSKTDKPGTN